MKPLRRLAALALGATVAITASVAAAPTASATLKPALGTKSLAAVLLADKSGFDHNGHDYDVLTAAVLAVLDAKPASPVGVLTDGKVPLTAFLPNDAAFRALVKSLTGQSVAKEKDVFAAVAGLGIGTVETVLLYHVVPGATITAKQALLSDGAKLTTAQGGTVTVDVRWHLLWPSLTLVDQDRNAANPRVVVVDINKGNRQIAHGIDRVLRPLDLPPLVGGGSH